MSTPRKATSSPVVSETGGREGPGSGLTTKMETEAVQRDAAGRVTKGTLNPGGLTKEARLVRDGMLSWLSSPEMQARFKEAYARLLDEGNPVITKDAAERYMGKVKDVVEHQGDASPLRLTMLTREEILAIAKGEKP